MPLHVVCPHCGHPNGVGKVFCGACGGNMQAAGRPPKIVSDQPGGSAPVRLAVLLLKLAGLLGPIALLVFIMMPMSSTTRPPRSRGPASEYDSSLRQVQRVLQAGVAAPFVHIVSEDQLNAKLATEIATANAGVTPGMGFMVKAITLDLLPRLSNDVDRVRVNMLTENKLGLKVTYDALCALRVGDQGLEVEILDAHLGHVPAIGPLKQALVGARLLSILGTRSDERDVLSRAMKVQIKDDQLALQLNAAKKS